MNPVLFTRLVATKIEASDIFFQTRMKGKRFVSRFVSMGK